MSALELLNSMGVGFKCESCDSTKLVILKAINVDTPTGAYCCLSCQNFSLRCKDKDALIKEVNEKEKE